VAGNSDLSYIITDEQDKTKRLAQASESQEKTRGKAKSAVEGG